MQEAVEKVRGNLALLLTSYYVVALRRRRVRSLPEADMFQSADMRQLREAAEPDIFGAILDARR